MCPNEGRRRQAYGLRDGDIFFCRVMNVRAFSARSSRGSGVSAVVFNEGIVEDVGRYRAAYATR